MDLDAWDSDDSLFKEARTQRKSKRKGKNVSKEAMNSIIQTTLKDHESTNAEHAKLQALQKENKFSDEALNDQVQSIIDSSYGSRAKPSTQPSTQEQAKIDTSSGYDGAFPKKDFEIMQELIDSEAVRREGTLSTIVFTFNDELFFESKEKACSALTDILAESKCKLGERVPKLIEKNLLKNFLRSDTFIKLLKDGEAETYAMIQDWLFKVACSAECNDDLSDLGFAAHQALQKVGPPSIAADSLRSLLNCWVQKPIDGWTVLNNSENLTGLRNVLMLAGECCSLDKASEKELGDVLTQLLLIGLDSSTTIGFRRTINGIFGPILEAIAQQQSTHFDAWSESWSKSFVGTIQRNYKDFDYWLSLPAAVRLVDITLTNATLSFRSSFATVVLLECTGATGTEDTKMDDWLQNECSEYLALAQKSVHGKSLCASYFALHHTLKCFDEIVCHQTRLRSIIEATFLAYCIGKVVFCDKNTTKDDLLLQEKFLADFDRATEKLQGGKTGTITNPHIMRADYLLSVIHSYNSLTKGILEERQRLFGQTKQTNLSTFFKPKSS